MEGFDPKPTSADDAAADNLKRLARMLDSGIPLNLKLNGRRVTLPADANLSIDLERDPRSGCVEVDIRWSLSADENGAGHSKRSMQHGPADAETSNARRKSHIRLKALVTSPTI